MWPRLGRSRVSTEGLRWLCSDPPYSLLAAEATPNSAFASRPSGRAVDCGRMLSALTKCPECWQIARRRAEAEGWPETVDGVLRALCRSTSLKPTARQQRALARPLAYFHLVLEELRDLIYEPILDEGYLRRTVMFLDLFLASFDGRGVEGLRDAEIGVHLLSAEFWAVRGRLGQAREELSDAEFCWRHGGHDPLLQAEIVLLQNWVERL